MSKESKEQIPYPSDDFETFLVNQKKVILQLRNELKSTNQKSKLLLDDLTEKEKSLIDLELSNNQHEAEIYTLKNNLEQLKEENSRILIEFHNFKQNYYELEINYDANIHQLYEQHTNDKQLIENLTVKCNDLENRLLDTEEDVQGFEQMKLNFEQQRKEIEIYKAQVVEEKNLNEEKHKRALETLQKEKQEAEEALSQCATDKKALETEKNCTIAQLKYKISQIEMACIQPTKFAQRKPLMILSDQKIDSKNRAEILSDQKLDNLKDLSENVAMGLPQVRKPLDNLTQPSVSNTQNQNQSNYQTRPSISSSEQSNMELNTSPQSLNDNKENEEKKQSDRINSCKFKRPLPLTSSQQTNITPRRKRRNEPRQLATAKKNYTDFSSSSSSSSDEDEENKKGYNKFCKMFWNPSKDIDYVVSETDTSAGFSKSKRSKK